ncbi:hypothetical protein [Micromonospora sp. KC207]|uniref:hypothetical protein n=1 Tax=Micromonospora sp. KC207 TaxID=2530377 RepID=UPI001FB6B43D|nr:hypothetical protein [Micromonospora sp. KC207]
MKHVGRHVPRPSAEEAADTWLATLAQRLIDGEVDPRTVSEHVSAFVSWHLDLNEISRGPCTDLHVIVDEWDQWGRGIRNWPRRFASYAVITYH